MAGASDAAPRQAENLPQASVPLQVTVVGDSLSEGSRADGNLSDPGSWAEYLSPAVRLVDGVRVRGATAEQLAERVAPVAADVLVIMAGTNDVLQQIDASRTLPAIESVAAETDIETVLLSAVPPSASEPVRAAQLNRDLEKLAAENDWLWIDPWVGDRADLTWTAGSSPDGTHASADAYRRAAERIEGLLLWLQMQHGAAGGSTNAR